MRHLKFLTTWYMSLYIWLHIEPALVIVVFFSSLTATPQAASQQSHGPALPNYEQGTWQPVGQISSSSDKTKPAPPVTLAQLISLLHHYQFDDVGYTSVENASAKQDIYRQSSNHYLQVLQFILLHSKHFVEWYNVCANSLKPVDHSENVDKESVDANLGTLLKEASSQPVFYSRLWHSVISQLLSLRKHSTSSLQNKIDPSKQNFTDKSDKPENYKAILFGNKNVYPYCARIFNRLFIPLNIFSETTGNKLSLRNHLAFLFKKFQNGENSNRLENNISLKGNFDKLVRRKKSVSLQSSLLKHKPINEFSDKSSSVKSKVISGILTESISSLYPTKFQKDVDVRSNKFLGNSKLGKWLSSLVKKFNNSDYNITQTQAEFFKNNSFADELKNIHNLAGSLSLFLDLAGHEGSENLSNNTSHERKNTENVVQTPNLLPSSHTVSSENVSTDFTLSHRNVPEKSDLLATDLPSVLVPVTDHSSMMKEASNAPGEDTVINSKTVPGNGKTGDSLTGSVDVSSSAITDVPQFFTTLVDIQQQTDNVQNFQFSGVVEDVTETVLPVIPITKKGMEMSENVVGTDKSSRAAVIAGAVFAVIVFLGFSGTVLFVLYRRYFLNKPHSFNDKCSNPDSSGYIDDSTLKENSEEMYSLDNDSFLNSLEAMTIQNYWTDSVKHTKL